MTSRSLVASSLLFASLFQGHALAQGAYHDRTVPWPLAPDTATPSAFGRAVSGQLDGDRVRDAAVLTATGEVIVFHDPALWTVVTALPASPVVGDLALLPSASGLDDALLTLDAGALHLWRWDDDPSTFVPETIGGPWTQPARVWSSRAPALGTPAVVWVLDGGTQALHPLTIDVPVTGPVDVLHFAAATRSAPVRDAAPVDWNGDGLPDIAVLDDQVLDVLAIWNVPLASFAASGGPLDRVSALGRNPTNLPRRIAWLSSENGNPFPSWLQVLGPLGIEAPIALPWPAVAVHAGRYEPFSLLDPTSDALLVAHGAIAAADVFIPDCDTVNAPESASSLDTFYALPGCAESLDRAAPAGSSLAEHLLADFDGDGGDDVLLLDDAQGSAHLYARAASGLSLQTITNARTLTSLWTQIDFTVDSPALQVRGATRFQLVAYAWPTYVQAGLDPVPLGDGVWNLPTQPGQVVLTLTQGASNPEVIAVELRAKDSNGKIVATDLFAFTDCATYPQLTSDFPDVVDPLSCETTSGQGDYLGGVRLPRFPPFVGGPSTVPILPSFPL